MWSEFDLSSHEYAARIAVEGSQVPLQPKDGSGDEIVSGHDVALIEEVFPMDPDGPAITVVGVDDAGIDQCITILVKRPGQFELARV